MDVILVDEQDQPVGSMEKMEVHQKALLHRAFSIFIFKKCCCTNGPIKNTTAPASGRTPAAAIPGPGKIPGQRQKKDCMKKWGL